MRTPLMPSRTLAALRKRHKYVPSQDTDVAKTWAKFARLFRLRKLRDSHCGSAT